ncbi:MAG: hypothetical protein CM1200mP10_27490 [Candidatus Neomarinimicrobiota bacterium]|nr:MAG: hypothetical protein CM1200mP10_27490 [Candidatus Neomarinimicrobiota bacterium]
MDYQEGQSDKFLVIRKLNRTGRGVIGDFQWVIVLDGNPLMV